MGVAVLVIRTRGQQSAAFPQVRADRAIGRVEFGVDDAALPAKPCPVSTIFAVALNREDGFKAVRFAQIKIILAVVRRHMDEASACIRGDKG